MSESLTVGLRNAEYVPHNEYYGDKYDFELESV